MNRGIDRGTATRLALGSLLALGLTTGCLFNVGNGTVVSPTVGKQLMDLEQAKKDKAISEEEYEKLRRRIIDQGPATEAEVPQAQGGEVSKDRD